MKGMNRRLDIEKGEGEGGKFDMFTYLPIYLLGKGKRRDRLE